MCGITQCIAQCSGSLDVDTENFNDCNAAKVLAWNSLIICFIDLVA